MVARGKILDRLFEGRRRRSGGEAWHLTAVETVGVGQLSVSVIRLSRRLGEGNQYPFLPVAPMTALNFCVEYPSFPPKQNHRPYDNQEVGETRKATQCQVSTQLVRHFEQEGQRRPLPPRIPVTMQRLHLAPNKALEVAYGVLVLEVRIVLAKVGRGVGGVARRGGGRAAIAAAGVASHDTANIGGRRFAGGQVDVG